MQIIIDIPEQMYLNAKADTLFGADILVSAIKNGVPRETVTEFADRCRECGRERVLDKIRAEIIELRSRQNVGVLECLDILDKYKAEIKSSVYEDKAERKTHSLVFDNEHEYQKFKNVLDTGWEPNF